MRFKFRILSLGVALIGCCCIGGAWTCGSGLQRSQEHTININYNLDREVITARLVRFRVADNSDHYHSLDVSAFYTYSRKSPQTDPKVELELYSVVRARTLNSDLYVVFVVDGKEIHFGSNRSSVPNPVPGRLWIGERMVFSVPLEEYRKLAAAKELAIKMGSVRFDLDEDARTSLKAFAETIKRIGP